VEKRQGILMAWLERAPLLVIWPSLVLAFLVALFVGYRGRWVIARIRGTAESGEKSDEAVGFLLSAALALLGLLIAFTFSMAAQRFDARRHMLMEEANAVGTTYLRFQLLDEPNRTALSGLLLSYLDSRLAFFSAGSNSKAVAQADARTSALEPKMWKFLSASVRAHPTATFNSPLLETTNDMFDLAASDRAARDTRVPLTILRAITLYSIIAALLLGQSLACAREPHLIAATTLFVLVGLSITLILDLDRPATGTITVSSAPFVRVADSIRAMEKARTHSTSPDVASQSSR
jgi:hypothetical protein